MIHAAELMFWEDSGFRRRNSVEVPGMALWHDSESSRCNNQGDPRRWAPENNMSACSRVFN
eukprot:2269380-Pyramimonas_sp.AAC.1